MSTSKITIVGAGLAGLVAGINLCRKGYEVEIWEAAKSLGMLEDFHPSVHATPIDPAGVSRYIGIDISPCFTAVKRFRMIVENEKFDLNPANYYLVERGGRKTSIDTYLYNIAVDMGINVRFDHYVRRLEDIPERAVVATGFDKEGMEAIGVPYEQATGAYARKKLDDPRFEDALMGWSGRYSTDYGYLSVANDLMFFLVFTRYPMSDENIEECKRHLEETEGLTFPKWVKHCGHTPVLGKDSLRLFKGNRVLAGTISGMIDPAGMFGIHGALMSGKIAELAYTDTERALEDFKRFNRNFHRVRVVSAAMRRMPMRLPMAHLMMRFPRLMTPSLKMIDDAIPGYERHWAVDMMKGRRKVSGSRRAVEVSSEKTD
jgi:flavin-dependent dehydrogenase